MKIALCTLYGNVNLGNKLQNYALIKIAGRNGDRVDTIVTHLTKRGIGFVIKSEIATALSCLGVKKYRDKAILWKREKIFQDFSKNYLNITKYIKFNNCKELASQYDFFITGSDQVWHKWSCAEKLKDPDIQLKYFYLMFAPSEKRISFAPSFGFENFPEEDIRIHRQGLNEIRYLSCREENGKNLIKKLTGRDAILLPDPTLCLSLDEWSEIERKPEKYEVPERYILVYFLGNISDERQIILQSLSEKYDAKIINIYDVHHPNGIQNTEFYLTGPAEFVYLIHNSIFVATDSFHASVFSVIFKKKFLVFRREEKGMEKMFNRIENLLNITGLSNCVYDGQSVEDIMTSNIDYSEIDVKMNHFATVAKTYLYSALNNNNE